MEPEPSDTPLWFFRELMLHREKKTAAISVICKGKCFYINLSPENFDQTPELLQKYLKLMEDINNGGDFDVSEEAEQDLQDWIIEPFLGVFESMEFMEPPLSQHRLTLHDYLVPETYRYQMYGKDGKLQPFLDYAVLPNTISDGITVDQNKLSPKWLSFHPKDIEIEQPSIDEALSQSPRKISVSGTIYHFKPVYTGNRSATLRELSIYNRLDEVFSPNEIRVPFLHGVVRDEHSSVIIGLLLSWIECGNENLECILSSETPLLLREKWRTQITATIQKLHDAGIVWGDAKPANILINSVDNDAWVVDFGGSFTKGWIEKSQMETVEGDLVALAKIQELLRPEKTERP